MPITNITVQPASGSLIAAYRPVVFKVEATATSGTKLPPFVVCDIYTSGIYYKSIFRTAPESIGANSSLFSFDIADGLQEVLAPDIAAITNAGVLAAPHMSAKVFCRFRASDIDARGFTIEEGVKPDQATRFTAAVTGGGVESNSFFAINAALQHEDNPDLAAHLNAFKKGGWHQLAWPLTHRNTYFFCNESSDHFPIVYSGPCTDTDLILHYRLRGTQAWISTGGGAPSACASLEFEVEVIGSRVAIHLMEALPAGHQVQLTYKLESDSSWSQPVFKTVQDFFFDAPATGDYDVRIIRFCSCCTTGAPVVHTASISANPENSNLAWRGRDPFCVQVQLPQDIYVSLQLRNRQTETAYYPNNSVYYQKNIEDKANLVALLFSDVSQLTPLNLQNVSLRFFVKKTESSSDVNSKRTLESYIPFEVIANGSEVVLGSVITQSQVNTYGITGSGQSPIMTPTGESFFSYNYGTYPTAKLIGGNTGKQGWTNLEQYNITTNTPTGLTKANAAGDADYIAPLDNEEACASGAPFTLASYGYKLDVSKVEFRSASGSLYATAIGDTGSGGYTYMLFVPKEPDTFITIKARTLDPGNKTGVVKVSVQLDNGNSQRFDVPNNIETQLPGVFKNVKVVNISNY